MKKPKKRTTREEDAGKYLLDLSKLIIGSVVIGGILRREIPQDIILIGGVIAAIVLFIFGLNMTTKEIKTNKTGRRKLSSPSKLAKPKRRKR